MALAKDYDYISYNQFLEYQEDAKQKIEYSNGEIYYMSPTHPFHNEVQNEIYFHLRLALKKCGNCKVYTSDVAVKFENNTEEHQFEPDVMVICDNKFDGAIYKGIPNLIVEVLSRATIDRDKGIKLSVYESFGVNEYWLVDINKKEITIYSDNIDGKYNSSKVYNNNMSFYFNDATITVDEILNTVFM